MPRKKQPQLPSSPAPLAQESLSQQISFQEQETQALHERTLHEQVRGVLKKARWGVVRSVNVEMVRAYREIGRLIIEHEQDGQERAGYGTRLLESLSRRLSDEGYKGFNVTNLKYIRQFAALYPIGHALRDQLSWTHYRLLLKVENPLARAFYEGEAAQGAWSTRELERQRRCCFGPPTRRATLTKRWDTRRCASSTLSTETLRRLWR